MTEETSEHSQPPRRKIHILGRTVHLPHSKPLRIAIGGGLIGLGIFGFLPVLGFWMVPLGLLVLSHDVAWARRRRRQISVWWGKRRRKNGSGTPKTRP
jgi:hypothetical protein